MDLTDFCLAVLTCFKMTLENINETKRVYTRPGKIFMGKHCSNFTVDLGQKWMQIFSKFTSFDHITSASKDLGFKGTEQRKERKNTSVRYS